MTALNEPLNLGDLLKYEEDCLNFSRDQVTVAIGENLELGAVVGGHPVVSESTTRGHFLPSKPHKIR